LLFSLVSTLLKVRQFECETSVMQGRIECDNVQGYSKTSSMRHSDYIGVRWSLDLWIVGPRKSVAFFYSSFSPKQSESLAGLER